MASPVIHLFRHAEAESNVAKPNVSDIRDPVLTTEGMKQAKSILKVYQFLNHPTLILTSPLRRTLQTTLRAFHPAFNRKAAQLFPTVTPRILALPHLQETNEYPCDTGSSLESLKADFGDYIEFPEEYFPENWFVKKETWLADDNKSLNTRAEFVKQFIVEQSCHKEIIVMTHANFAHFLVNRWMYGMGCGSKFDGLHNAEGRPMVLREKDPPESGYMMSVDIPVWWG